MFSRCCGWGALFLVLGLSGAGSAQARDLMLVSQGGQDSYYMDVDDIQSAPDFGFRAATLYRLMSATRAKQEGYDYTQTILGFNCQKAGEVTLVQVIAFRADGQRLGEEHPEQDWNKMEWFNAPEGTHYGQAWQATCRDRRSNVRLGNVSPQAVLQQERRKQSGAIKP